MIDEQLLNIRVIPLKGDISEEITKQVIAKMLFLQYQDAVSPIELWVDSNGGNVLAALAIVETIKNLLPPVHTRAMARAHGVAAVIVACGRKGQRRANKDSRLSIVPLEFGDGASTKEDGMERLLTDVVGVVAVHTGQTADKVAFDFERGRYMDATQAQAYGLIDTVMD